LPDYNEFVSGLVKDGCYSDMLTVLALSSVVQKPIQTRWPVPKRDGSVAAPTKLVIGRGTKTFLQRCCAVVYAVEQSCVHIVIAFQLCSLLCGRAVCF